MKQARKTGFTGLLIEVAGWLLVAAGIVALVLPGPGLLGIFAGLVLLASRHEWAEQRLEPVKALAIKAARDSVASWPQIISSGISAGLLAVAGVVWGLQPAVPGWWPLPDALWLPGGWATGATLISSAVLAVVILGYSYRRFR